MHLGLGTVSFGMAYGLRPAARRPCDAELRAMLETAFLGGVRMLDTAPAYGDVEERLAALTAGLDFRITSKIPALPAALDDAAAVDYVQRAADRSLERLGGRLSALLFHREEDLHGVRGRRLYEALAAWAAARQIRVGVSGYCASTTRALAHSYRLPVVQLPGNAFDQRLHGLPKSSGHAPEIHVRSAFLQGLLLLPFDVAVQARPDAAGALSRWHAWLRQRAVSPAVGALSIVKSFAAASTVVVGVDGAPQLDELLAAWRDATPVAAHALASEDMQLIDPRRWRVKPS